MINSTLDTALFFFWVIVSMVSPSFSFSSGAVIYYLLEVERGKKDLSIPYFLIIVSTSVIIGHYTLPLVPFLIDYVSDAIPTIKSGLDSSNKDLIMAFNFFLGLFFKILLDIIMTKGKKQNVK